MKKFLALLLALGTMLTLAACEGKTEDNTEASTTESVGTSSASQPTESFTPPEITVKPQDFSFEDIVSRIEDPEQSVNWGKQSKEVKQKVIDSLKAEGWEVVFGNDGSMKLNQQESGITMIQSSDGSWTGWDKDGNQSTVGKKWPDSKLTRLLPKPSLRFKFQKETKKVFIPCLNQALHWMILKPMQTRLRIQALI